MVDRRYTPSEKRVAMELASIKTSLEDIQKPTGTEKNRSLLQLQQAVDSIDQQQQQLIELFNSLPQNDGRQVNTSGWSVNTAPAAGSWTTIASASIPRPANMNRVAVTVIATASAILNSGSYGAAMQSRVLISGVSSTIVEGSIEYMASVERTHTQQGFFREIQNLSANVQVQFQVRGRMSEFAASNVASLTVSAGFTRVGL